MGMGRVTSLGRKRLAGQNNQGKQDEESTHSGYYNLGRRYWRFGDNKSHELIILTGVAFDLCCGELHHW